MHRPLPKVAFQEIGAADLPDVAKLLSRGFQYSKPFWDRALARLATRDVPDGYPRYGYMLRSEGRPVGAFPMVFARIADGGTPHIRCSNSSWYVEDAFRAQATMLASRAIRDRDVTYVVVTPQPHVVPILEAQGYQAYCQGRFVAAPALSLRSAPCTVVPFTADATDGLTDAEMRILSDHAGYGCLVLLCRTGRDCMPFVFSLHRKAGVVRFASLIFCRAQDDFVRFAAPLGRALLRRGVGLVVLDASGPIPGLVGRYSGGYPNLFRGPHPPRLGDLAYSKRVFFGV